MALLRANDPAELGRDWKVLLLGTNAGLNSAADGFKEYPIGLGILLTFPERVERLALEKGDGGARCPGPGKAGGREGRFPSPITSCM